jgi:uncharacterized OB-fold protein
VTIHAAPAGLKRFEPPIGEDSVPFWDATREQRLVLPWCTACEKPIWYPRPTCPRCLSSSIEWRPASGRGEVYAVTVDHKPQNPGLAAMAPFAVALVELDEGVRLVGNVVGGDPEQVTVGMPVVVAWEPLSDGRHLPVFERSEAKA